MGPLAKDLLQILVMPITIVILGLIVKAIATQHEKRLSLRDRIIEKRINVYEAIGRDLDDVFSYAIRVGSWKEFSPAEILNKKRKIDREMWVSRPYWSDKAFSSYKSLIGYIFERYAGKGQDAKIRGELEEYKILTNWSEDWIYYFSSKPINSEEAWNRYDELMRNLGRDFGYQQ